MPWLLKLHVSNESLGRIRIYLNWKSYWWLIFLHVIYQLIDWLIDWLKVSEGFTDVRPYSINQSITCRRIGTASQYRIERCCYSHVVIGRLTKDEYDANASSGRRRACMLFISYIVNIFVRQEWHLSIVRQSPEKCHVLQS